MRHDRDGHCGAVLFSPRRLSGPCGGGAYQQPPWMREMRDSPITTTIAQMGARVGRKRCGKSAQGISSASSVCTCVFELWHWHHFIRQAPAFQTALVLKRWIKLLLPHTDCHLQIHPPEEIASLSHTKPLSLCLHRSTRPGWSVILIYLLSQFMYGLSTS